MQEDLLDFLQSGLDTSNLTVYRLGKVGGSSPRIRPIKVRLADEKDVKKLMRNY